MKFSVNPTVKKVKGSLIYRSGEYSFDFEPVQAVDLTLLYNYLQLQFDSETMIAKQIWGFNPYGGWINKELTIPKATEGGFAS